MRLLIAEDELDLAEALTVFFEKNHFSVDAVHNGFDAYEYASTGEYDAVILDVMMPKLDGIQVLERLRQNPKLDTVYLCLDNDEAGEDACDGMLDTLEDMGYDVERLRPEGKDWNDDLRAKRGGHG